MKYLVYLYIDRRRLTWYGKMFILMGVTLSLVRCNMANSKIIGAGQDTARPAPKTLARPTRQKEIEQLALFDFEPDWKTEWWGMSEFTMGDATPQYRITINFLTLEDVKEFSKRLELNLGAKSDTAWFPPQKLDEPKEWAYVEN